MPELRVVAVSNDGTRLVLKAADSTEYTLPIDERLRAAVRNDRARLGQIEIEVESHLRPRDIQARIRAGASAEEVAQFAGIPVDRVRRFEGPVLAERAFMAERARKTPVRRPGENTGPQLGEAVQERLLLRGADKETVQWDSWRRDDGTWEVLLVYRVAGEPHSASWTYDPPRRLVQAVDDEARSLIGETDDVAAPEPSFPFVPRIARLPRDRPLDRALDRQMERPAPPPPPEPDEHIVTASASERDSLTSLLEAVPSFRGDMVVPERPAPPEPPPTTPAAQEPEADEPPAAAASAGAGSAYADVLMPRAVAGHRDRLTGTTDRQAEADGVRPGRRAAVPSWDEIVFGTRRKKQD
ncbi:MULTISPECIES: septation protein SepH [unclassified Streptomyces]|uniref:septation protein SepH n=1 Tax=unclassified Streptomyces TaxID=2593676 RepID=UPI002DDA58E5|nr:MULTISPECIES: septation protein SepH [unclassified Streptomyces]WSA79580.1 septation protein SepH [Streptomyces sp. NBC_01799]WSF83995.1 septation protein SepH [Streptomyces sp. NBC_01744]WSA71071.1 septation protein SepH [Streptomyces sp. NBC_01800]WSC39720.1 septation protein SepH [Streptomyces sp. NBC_01763]WSC47859.1 septation protein SepH [Streptomyces sp. NBC_01762]